MKKLMALLFLTMTTYVFGQDRGCNSLLQYGIYNTVSTQTSYSEFRIKVRNFCSTYESDKYSEKNIKAAASAFGIGGEVSYSHSELDRIYNASCSNATDINDIKSNMTSYSSFADPELLASYVKCKELENRKLFFDIKPTDDSFEIFTVSIRDNSPADAVRPTLERVDVTASLANIRTGSDILPRPVKLDRVWSTQLKRNKETTGDVIFNKGQITFKLDVDVFTVNLPMIYKPIKFEQGLGEIVASMLDEGQFKRIYDVTGKVEWVLADGRKVTGSDYTTYTGNENIPDLRGIFLRGRNYDRQSTTGNSSGDIKVGEFQNDATRNPDNLSAISAGSDHNHAYGDNDQQEGLFWSGTVINGGGYWFKFWPAGVSTLPGATLTDGPAQLGKANRTRVSGSHAHSIGGGDPETRPKNITVNYFICIKSHTYR